MNPCSLSDAQLLASIDQLASEERGRLGWFLALLAEADRRRLAENIGYTSTFDFCVRRLKFSEDESYRRIQAARAAASRPELLSALADGRLSLSAVSKIAPHVRRADAPEIIARAEGKSTREVEAILAPLCPEPVKPDRIRTVAVAAPKGNDDAPPAALLRVDFSFQGSAALREALERAQNLLAHKIPFAGLGEVIFVVVRDYLERHDPQKALELGRRARPQGSPSIPASVRRAVWARDGGRCTYIAPGGLSCSARRMLELDHKIPRALGGPSTVENLRLLCRSHNDAERRRILGEGSSRPKSGEQAGMFD
ncbi:MAG: HNH endonuclease [Elusimicrobia bacterium]|nr:HNH endonuclease [Elusimicrobiota bacterium]